MLRNFAPLLVCFILVAAVAKAHQENPRVSRKYGDVADCLFPAGPGIPHQTYVFNLQTSLDIQSSEDCNRIFDALEHHTKSAFHSPHLLWQAVALCQLGDVSPNFTFLSIVEPWNQSVAYKMIAALHKINGTVVEGITMNYKNVKSVLTDDSISLSKNDGIGEDKLFDHQYGSSQFSSFVSLCHHRNVELELFELTSPQPTFDYIESLVGEPLFSDFMAALPEATSINLSHDYAFKLGDGTLSETDIDMHVSRNCHLFSCER